MFFCLSIINSNASTIPINIELTIDNVEEGLKIYLLDIEATNQVIDSAYVKDAHVTFNLQYQGPFFAGIEYEFNPKKHTTTGAFLFLVDSALLKIHADFKTFRNTRVNCEGINKIMCLSYQLTDSSRSVYSNPKQTRSNEIYKTYQNNCLHYIINYPNEYGSIYMLGGLMYNFNRDTLLAIYNLLNDENKESKVGKKLATYLAFNTKIKVGEQFIDITGINRFGDTISLSDFKGKVILLDFWNSHCVPCLMQKPYLSNLYSSKKDSGFVVFSFFLDKSFENFTKSTIKDEWIHVTDNQGFFSKYAIAYEISSIPILILIGKDGKILRIFTGHEFGENAYSDLNILISQALK